MLSCNPAVFQNLSLEKPKKKAGKGIGHSRTLSRVEAMGGMVGLQSASSLVNGSRFIL